MTISITSVRRNIANCHRTLFRSPLYTYEEVNEPSFESSLVKSSRWTQDMAMICLLFQFLYNRSLLQLHRRAKFHMLPRWRSTARADFVFLSRLFPDHCLAAPSITPFSNVETHPFERPWLFVCNEVSDTGGGSVNQITLLPCWSKFDLCGDLGVLGPCSAC